jgi:Arc/MetJ-type ribon-helix-helix transcriptional regulator
MAKSTVRFSEGIIDRIERLVDGEVFDSKSEFQRFAAELLLTEIGDYEPEMVNFDKLRKEVIPPESFLSRSDRASNSDEFYRTAARIRQFGVRGEIAAGKEAIDDQYPPSDPRSMILDDILKSYSTSDGE